MPFYVLEILVVPLAGLEPAHLAVPDFKSPLILLHSYSQLLTSHLQRLDLMEVLQHTATHYIAALLMQNNWRCLHYAFAREVARREIITDNVNGMWGA